MKARGFLAVADQATVSFTNFFTAIIIGRSSSQAELGLYTLGFSVILIINNLQNALISLPYSTYMPRYKENSLRLYTGSTFIHQLGLSFIIIACLLALRLTFSNNTKLRELEAVVWILILMIAFITLKEYIRRFFFALLKIKKALLLDFIIAIGQIGGITFLAIFGALTAERCFLVTGICCAFMSLFFLALYRSDFSFSLSQAKKDFIHNFSFAKWLFFARLLSLASIQIYPWLLTFFHGTALTGAFAACLGTVGISTFFLLGSGNFLYPLSAKAFHQGGVKKLRNIIIKVGGFFAIILGIFLIMILFLGGWLVTMLYGAKFSNLEGPVSILALSQFFFALLVPLEAGLVAIEQSKKTFWGHALGFVLTISVGFSLTVLYGPIGAAWGLVIYYASVGICFYFSLKAQFKHYEDKS